MSRGGRRGSFGESFIRAYAQAVGLDPDETTREFLERFPDPNNPNPPPRRPAHPRSALRLTLADTGTSFMRGRILASVRGRWAAIACDATVILTIGLAMYLAMGTLWMPLCVALIGYYAGAFCCSAIRPACACVRPGTMRTIHRAGSRFGVAFVRIERRSFRRFGRNRAIRRAQWLSVRSGRRLSVRHCDPDAQRHTLRKIYIVKVTAKS